MYYVVWVQDNREWRKAAWCLTYADASKQAKTLRSAGYPVRVRLGDGSKA